MRVNGKTTMERVYDMEEKLDKLEVAMGKLEENMQSAPYKFGKRFRECICQEVQKETAKQLFEILKDNNDRDIRIFHMMSQMDSTEKSIKGIERKFKSIIKQLREERKKQRS